MKSNLTLATGVMAAAVCTLSLPSLSLAQAGPELLLRPMEKGLVSDGDISASYFFQRDTPQSPGDSIQLQRYVAEARLRLKPEWEADPRVGASYSLLDLGNHVPEGLSKQYTNLQLSVGTGIAKYDNWVAGLVVGAGYAGSNAFGDGNGYFGTATLLIGRTYSETFDIGFALDYNGNRTFMPDVPLPGIVVHTKLPDYNLEVSLGFPFAYGRWRPTEKLLLEANFTFPDFIGGRVSYDLVKGVGLFASLTQSVEAFHDSELTDSQDRVIFYQNLVEGGVRLSLNDRLTVLFTGGYAYAQDFRYGFDTRNDHEITQIADGPFVRLEGQFRF